MKVNMQYCKIFLVFIIIGFSVKANSLSSVAKVGTISFTLKGKIYKLNAEVVKKINVDGYDITTGLNGGNDNILLSLPKLSSANFNFGSNQFQSSAWVNNIPYHLNDGQINIIIEGKQLSGKFTAKMYEPDGKGGYKAKPTETISGTFTNIIIP